MNTPPKVEVLKCHLGELTFARIDRVIAKSKDLRSFKARDGVIIRSENPEFERERSLFTEIEWPEVEKTFEHYFGFARSETEDIYFQARTQSRDDNFCCLGITTRQNRLILPKDGSLIVGRWSLTPKGKRFQRWALCSEEERLFTEFLLGKRSFAELPQDRIQKLKSLCIIVEEDVPNTRLMSLAALLILRDFEYFLDLRSLHGGLVVDYEVKSICEEFDLGLWEGYKRQASAQGVFSALVPRKLVQV